MATAAATPALGVMTASAIWSSCPELNHAMTNCTCLMRAVAQLLGSLSPTCACLKTLNACCMLHCMLVCASHRTTRALHILRGLETECMRGRGSCHVGPVTRPVPRVIAWQGRLVDWRLWPQPAGRREHASLCQHSGQTCCYRSTLRKQACCLSSSTFCRF